MLFMLWIKYKFSEYLAPCTNMKAPNGRLSGDGSAQTRRHGGIWEQLPPNLFCPLPNFVMLRKMCFKYMIKTKVFPPKNVFCPLNLTMWLRAWFCQNFICN